MNQSKLESSLESFCNIGSGFIVAMLTWEYIAGPLYDAGYVETFGITCIFTVISYYRSYFWRRFFNAGIHNFIHNSVKRFLNT